MATTHPPATQSSTSPNGSSTAKPPSSLSTKSLHNGENPASNVTKTSAPNASTTQKGTAAVVQQAGQQPTQQSPTLGGDSNANFKFDFYGSTPSMSNLSFGSFPSLPSLASMPPGSMPVEVGSNGVLPPPADNGRLVPAPATSSGGRPVVPQQPTQQQAPQMQQAPPRGGAPAQQSRGSGGAQGSRPSGGSQNLTPLQPHPSAPAASGQQQPPQQPQAMPPQPAPSSPGSSSTAVVPASPGQSDRRVINPVTVPNGQNFVDITEYLNMPQSEAAKKLSIPPSTLSKRWKEAVRNRKWPWRVVCKLDKEIMTLLHNVPQGAPIPEEIEGRLGYLMRKRQEELKPVVIRL